MFLFNKKKKEVEKEIKIKLLLVGTGFGGKSTIFKQLKLITKNEELNDEEYILNYKNSIIYNIMFAMKTLCIICTKKNLELENKDNIDFLKELIDYDDSDMIVKPMEMYTEKVFMMIKSLLEEKSINLALSDYQEEFHISEGIEYFLNNIDQFNPSSFLKKKLNDQDILYSRRKTIGISQMHYKINNTLFEIFDVGGQRGERKKWEKAYDGVKILIFVVGINEYNMVCYEDDKTNRLLESLYLFEQICNGGWFRDTPIMIVFNKIDIFQAKIGKIPLGSYFDDYNGGYDFENAIKYLENLFYSKNKENRERINICHVNAIDSSSVINLMNSIYNLSQKYYS
jgi:GTPase SAR1 family protein